MNVIALNERVERNRPGLLTGPPRQH